LTCFRFFLRSHIDWHITIFLKNIEHFTIEAPLWTVNHKIETNLLRMAHLFSLYMKRSNFGQTIWDKTGVLFRTCLGEQVENLGNRMGTHTLGTREKKPPPSSLSPYVMQSDKLWSRLHAITAAGAPFMHPKNGRKELSTWKRGWSSSASCLPEVMYLYSVNGVDILYGETDCRCSCIHLLLLTIITTANW
jgi:hypothetical protein